MTIRRFARGPIFAALLCFAASLGFEIPVHGPLAGPPAARAQSAGAVAGTVVNSTPGGSVPAGFQVTLVTLDADGNVRARQTAGVDSADQFEFASASPDADTLLRLVTDYEGVITTIRIEDQADPANVTLEIHETTRSLDSISITSEAFVVRADPKTRTAGVLEYITFRNDGDRTFVADLTSPSLTGLDMFRFTLPDDFQDLSDLSVDPPLPSGSILQAGPGFALTNPIPPGEYKLLFDYFVTYDGGSFNFTRTLPFGADEIRVLIFGGQGTVSGQGIARIEDVTLGEQNFAVYRGTGYERGDQVDFVFSQLPVPGFWQSARDSVQHSATYLKVGVPVGAAVIMVGLIAYVFLWRRRGESAGEGRIERGQGRERTTADGERAGLVREIASLDEEFEAGEIEEVDYRRRRAELAERALRRRDSES